tara:strand:+ start:366 stop:740 length:375 start_codon:yes stop_codon:yes gene_type:complete
LGGLKRRCCTSAARCFVAFDLAFFAVNAPPEEIDFLFFFCLEEGIADAMPSSSARVSAAGAGSKRFANASPERSVSRIPGDIVGLVLPSCGRATMPAFAAAAACVVSFAAATLPVSLSERPATC